MLVFYLDSGRYHIQIKYSIAGPGRSQVPERRICKRRAQCGGWRLHRGLVRDENATDDLIKQTSGEFL